MTDKVYVARERMGRAIFENWPEQDVADLVRLMRRLADAMTEEST